MKRFNVVIPRDDGGIEVYPMKEWLRQHPDHIPDNLDPTLATSHQLRNALRRRGWSVQETPTEERLLLPGSSQLESVIDEVLGDENSAENTEEIVAAFALEYQLRDFLAQNLSAIPVEGERLSLFVDSIGRDGIEYPTGVGPIDILAVDEQGNFVVFELKRARSPDSAIGQLARYMGWVSQTIGRGKKVRGVIVAKKISDNLRYAVTVIPSVSIFEYEVKFELQAIQQAEG